MVVTIAVKMLSDLFHRCDYMCLDYLSPQFKVGSQAGRFDCMSAIVDGPNLNC
ncbi:hypothetical protein Sjap_022451 [Stephania japonica]|uniref:Uncharacterized protein n=1 Tax=Stephania japonica TaxID=461633 RepID=A0AAP0EXR0_9MAGN